jgi:hypothetical protein
LRNDKKRLEELLMLKEKEANDLKWKLDNYETELQAEHTKLTDNYNKMENEFNS